MPVWAEQKKKKNWRIIITRMSPISSTCSSRVLLLRTVLKEVEKETKRRKGCAREARLSADGRSGWRIGYSVLSVTSEVQRVGRQPTRLLPLSSPFTAIQTAPIYIFSATLAAAASIRCWPSIQKQQQQQQRWSAMIWSSQFSNPSV